MEIAKELKLPCGAVLKNRMAKAAMSEQLGNLKNEPTNDVLNVYQKWAEGGAGLLITGNVMINKLSLGEPRNIVFNGNEHCIDLFKKWTSVSRNHGQHLWVQINHPGRQALNNISKEILAPSKSKISLIPGVFGEAKELPNEKIEELISQFVSTAVNAKEFGFSGIQIHGAHGYLVSQFLSPLTNKREDEWCGSIENRARFLLEIIKRTRSKVGPEFPISVKINSADFQRGGFTQEDCIEVLKMLDKASVDLVEISGGTYEAPAMISGEKKKESTKKREAYFFEFAEMAKQYINIPLMLTGGFRSAEGMNAAVASGKVDLVGLARPMVWMPDFPNKIINNEVSELHKSPPSLPVQKLKHMAELTWYVLQIGRLAKGKGINYKSNAFVDLVKYIGQGQTDAIKRKFL